MTTKAGGLFNATWRSGPSRGRNAMNQLLLIDQLQRHWRNWLWKVKVKVAQSCPTLCNPMGYTVHGILQARILEWVAVFFSRGSSWPRNQSQVSCMEGEYFTSWATSEAWDLLWIFTNITSWGGKGENRTNTSTYIGLLPTTISLWTKKMSLYE